MADFDVDPAALRSGSGQLNDAGSGLSGLGSTASMAAGSAAGAAGEGPLAGALQDFGAAASEAIGLVAQALAAAGSALTSNAGNYETSDSASASHFGRV